MWNNFVNEGIPYIMKCLTTDTTHKILLSDMINVFIEKLTDEQIFQNCLKMNPLIRTDRETYRQTVLSLVNDVNSLSKSALVRFDDSVIINFKSKLAGVPFRFELILKQSDAATFCNEITLPLINTVQLLEKQQKILCDIIEKKDTEIQQHIFENGELRRQQVITDKFDRNSVNQTTFNNLCFNIFTNSEEFNTALTKKHGCVEPSLLIVKKEKSESTSTTKNTTLAGRILRNRKLAKRTKFSTKVDDQLNN